MIALEKLLPKPQMFRHAFKTALAAYLSLFVSSWIGLEYGYWAAISAVIVMQADLGGSIRAGLWRLTGTFIGAGVGIACLWMSPPSPALLAAGLFVVILTCSSVPGLRESFRIAGITVCIVVLGTSAHHTPLAVGTDRFLEIAVGVFSAVLVSGLLWPAHAVGILRNELALQLLEAASLYRTALEHLLVGGPAVERKKLDGLLALTRGNRELLDKARREASPFTGRRAMLLARFVDAVDRLVGHARALDRLTRALPSGGYHQEVRDDLEALAKAMNDTLDHIAGDLSGRPETGRAPDIRPYLHRVEEHLQELRDHGAPKGYPLDAVANLYSLFEHLKALAKELILLREVLERSAR
ncbi:FUSC family protein [Paucidesulfovibrio longus]|uniref:FUSC family protein n=1 Tax=Paucidesulfovibrio longus TaxID=889 RepID=UPI0003B3AA63|nr:FUSC family protein [Paucidesulfovibrio longus]